MRTYVRMVVCVYLPRFELVVAAGGEGTGADVGRQTLVGRALAVAPLPGGGRHAVRAVTARRAAGVGGRRCPPR